MTKADVISSDNKGKGITSGESSGERNLIIVEEVHRLLFEPDFMPDWFVREHPGRTVINPGERYRYAMVNFMQFIRGLGPFPNMSEHVLAAPLDGDDQGRTYGQVVKDIDEIIAELKLDPAARNQELITQYNLEVNDRGFPVHESEDRRLELHQYLFPIFAKLVLDMHYQPISIGWGASAGHSQSNS